MSALVDVVSIRRPTKARAIPWEKASWPALAVILMAQAILSVRLVAGTYASGDEGRYIYAGHQLVYELWHGGGSPYFETYFSGAPVLYPVLAAMADHMGGLLEVCLMSLAFMMTATVTLFATTRRLFGYVAGIFAAGLFAGLGITQDLGALATYDGMALMLMAAAAYCAVRTADTEKNATTWLAAIPFVLLLANATKYMTVIFDPVVIGLAALQINQFGIRRMALRVVSLGVTTGALLIFTLFLAGGAYLKGLLFSTLARSGGTSTVFAAVAVPDNVILADTWKWMGVAVAGSAVSLAIAIIFRRNLRLTALIGLFLLAGLLVTAEGLHLHTVESMRKHDDFAAWFACLAAGSVARHFYSRRHRLAAGITTATVIFAAVLSGIHYSKIATSTFEAGGSKTPLMVATTLKPYLELRGGRFLLGGLAADEIVYMVSVPVPWWQQNDDLYIKYPVPGRGGDSHGQTRGLTCMRPRPNCMYLEGIAGYRAAIHAHWFTLISMWGDHGTVQDAEIEQAVRHTPGYVLLTTVGHAPTWIYAPAYRNLTGKGAAP